MAMSRDGLLPPAFSRIHPRFRTPSFSTVITGIVVVIPTLFMDLTFVTDLCSIGTLFAFVLVCAGVLKLNADPNSPKPKFKTPYINSGYVMPFLLVVAVSLFYTSNPAKFKGYFTNQPVVKEVSEIITSLPPNQPAGLLSDIGTSDSIGLGRAGGDLEVYLLGLKEKGDDTLSGFLTSNGVQPELIFLSGWNLVRNKIPHFIFFIVVIVFTFLSVTKRLSLIPLLGMLCCLYMMSELGLKNWIGFGLWLSAGLLIYFLYGYRNSKLAARSSANQ
jgi:amino acid transporter